MPERNEYIRIGKQLLRERLAIGVGLSFLASGRDAIALEISQLTLYNRMAARLAKQFKKTLGEKAGAIGQEYAAHRVSPNNNVWVLWFQGENNAPACVRTCIDSIRSFLPGKKITVLDESNIFDFVALPDHILEKYRAGIISKTHFSDIVRAALLSTLGGTWIDATVLLTQTPPVFYTDSPLFLLQTLRPGNCGQRIPLSTWFITSQQTNRTLILVRELLYSYWRTHNHIADYFLVHYCIQFALDQYPEERSSILPCTNEHAQILLTKLAKPFDEEMWSHIKSLSPIHKTSYKIHEKCGQDSYYQRILVDGNRTT